MVNKDRLHFFLRVIVSVLVIAFIVSKVNFEEVTALLPKVKIHFAFLGLAWLLFDKVVMSYRWGILLWAKKIEIPIYKIIRIYFLSSFWGTFLPSSFGPDFIKIYVTKKYGSNSSDVLSSVVVDRAIGLFSLSLMAFLAIFVLFSYQRTEQNLNILVAILTILLLTAAFMVFFDRLPINNLKRLFRIRDEGFIDRQVRGFYESCQEYKSNKSALVKVFSISFFNNILVIFMTYVIFLSLDLHVSVLYLFVFVPLINFITMIPISIGGIGIQEGAYVYFFSQTGMSVQEALAVALILRFLMLVSYLPGGLVYMSDGFEIKKASL
jgi:uncharacterized protein (TIRG00374 family)